MTHVVLLGDSTFDNASYVRAGEDITSQLARQAPSGVKIALLAKDGAQLSDIAEQLSRVPRDASHLVVSIGGNDAFAASFLLREKVNTIEDAVSRLARTALATIYEPHFGEAAMRAAVGGALPLFNDVITRLAFRHALSLLDLRLICNEAGDFTSGIEPSAQGSRKIAAAIAHLMGEPVEGSVSFVYAR
jgi:lysophospholipase L1-like esterase